MKNLLFSLLSSIIFLGACSQEPVKTSYPFTLGDATIQLEKAEFENAQSFFFVVVHNNERTAVEASEQVAKNQKINYLLLLNQEKRMIDFNFNNKTYSIDPNRIYTEVGRLASLSKHTTYDEEVLPFLYDLHTEVLGKIDTAKNIIAVHNNTDGNYSINSYIKDLQQDVDSLHINSAHDPDNFYLTTDAPLFTALKQLGYNVVLQHNQNATDDGSMSVYYGRQNQFYVNVETQHGQLEEQVMMIELLLQILREREQEIKLPADFIK